MPSSTGSSSASSPASKTSERIVSLVTILFTALVSSFVSFHFSQFGELKRRKYELSRQTLSNILEKTIDYSNYNTVAWEKLEKVKRAYNCDFDEDVNEILLDRPEDKADIPGVYCEHHHVLKNAKEDFRKLTTGARVTGSPRVIDAIAQVEIGFDEVMLGIAEKGHYGRARIDQYNTIMIEKFENLEREFRKEIEEYERWSLW